MMMPVIKNWLSRYRSMVLFLPDSLAIGFQVSANPRSLYETSQSFFSLIKLAAFQASGNAYMKDHENQYYSHDLSSWINLAASAARGWAEHSFGCGRRPALGRIRIADWIVSLFTAAQWCRPRRTASARPAWIW